MTPTPSTTVICTCESERHHTATPAQWGDLTIHLYPCPECTHRHLELMAQEVERVRKEAYSAGLRDGRDDVGDEARDAGYDDGFEAGKRAGYEAGLEARE
jgi:hypothetical protein